jgi:flagellar hook-associated protein 3 FlgL
VTEASLTSISDNVHHAHKIALQAANDTVGEKERSVFASQIQDILDRILAEANRRHGTKYVFGGTDVDSPPFSLDTSGAAPTVVENTDGTGTRGVINREIGLGEEMQINVSGGEVFIDNHDVFQILLELKESLANNDVESIKAGILDLNDSRDQINKYASLVGLRYGELQERQSTLEKYILQIKRSTSSVEDADIAESALNFQVQESNYQAILQFGSRVLQTSLVDYLG